jgi:Transcriptional regulator, AbiEi antitoxin, Type IV TA system/Transcriptional regulator, AbiEi antitoxin N-terminal domain
MTKINQLINKWPKGTIKTVEELVKLGYTPQLLKIYSNSGWIESVVRGMYKLYQDEVNWQGILYGLQNKSKTTLHAGGKTALALKGYSHYLSLRESKVYLFSDRTENFKVWMKKFNQVILKRNKVFDYSKEEYFTMFNTGNFEIKISSPELAAMEMLYLVPKEQSVDEADKIMEGLTTLRPNLVQSLLENCNSVKVKRLFLYLGEKNKHSWMEDIKSDGIDLGTGKRLIVKKGVYNRKYKITVPGENAR